jgi:hypothetical protein
MPAVRFTEESIEVTCARCLMIRCAVLVNRIAEALYRRSAETTELRDRARVARASRGPVIFVPSCFGVRLRSADGALVWGATRRLLWGRSFAQVETVTPDGLVDHFGVVPGIYQQDVYGALLRYLVAVGGYRWNQDLFSYAYDWRRPLADSRAGLAALVARVERGGRRPVDVIAVSSGGVLVRHYLAWGGRDPLRDPHADAAPGSSRVRRVIYLAVPHRGTFSAFGYTQTGVGFVGRGRPFTWQEAQASAGIWEMLPHPAEPMFLDESGAPMHLPLYLASTWRDLGLHGAHDPSLATRLTNAAALHAGLAAQPPGQTESVVVAARDRPTAARAVMRRNGLYIPCGACGDQERYPTAMEPGDGVIPAATMAAAPNLLGGVPHWITVSAHHRIASDAHLRPVVLRALLA